MSQIADSLPLGRLRPSTASVVVILFASPKTGLAVRGRFAVNISQAALRVTRMTGGDHLILSCRFFNCKAGQWQYAEVCYGQ
ncbi:hypothetical protein AW19_4158 (plasmid) [Yersinia frederiksenii Y225]|nr:hypothetical protein AW19_4158 [Yersinia frederiksenii Y225]